MTKDTRFVVWIVDDSVPVRKSIAAVLDTADLVVRDYGSAKEFLADFVPTDIGCLVADHHMPDMTGLELLLHLRRAGITVPFILITGMGNPVLQQKALKAGAVTMLHKPMDADELITLIESMIAAGA